MLRRSAERWQIAGAISLLDQVYRGNDDEAIGEPAEAGTCTSAVPRRPVYVLRLLVRHHPSTDDPAQATTTNLKIQYDWSMNGTEGACGIHASDERHLPRDQLAGIRYDPLAWSAAEPASGWGRWSCATERRGPARTKAESLRRSNGLVGCHQGETRRLP
jgi:hypothetical protein